MSTNEPRQSRSRWRPGRRYWRHHPFVAWWFMYVVPERCMSCERRRGHDDGCYFA